jgi:hypothetical protein
MHGINPCSLDLKLIIHVNPSPKIDQFQKHRQKRKDGQNKGFKQSHKGEINSTNAASKAISQCGWEGTVQSQPGMVE